ncbi:FAD/NAD(P)-binding domain-containing protein [Patellaria atrata CBS 101060]|uniref:FAD/NAD(P)-binding domain-containing protein n=1 Tax=Patellaria atrata CBS 101060 TaxID=1346257 RepID=A0A9P4VML0_9PEZI|nr:FAD/NAD(P)-binding domain-containing protein [Patellaria atrata CBS 101060]
MESNNTGVRVIIVGAGFAGLTAAIECHRQGHDVEIYEKFAELKQLGDIISFGQNAGRIFHRWSNGSVTERMDPLSIKNKGFNIHKYDGEFIINQTHPKPPKESPIINGHRGELHAVVFNYAKDELAIPIHLDSRVKEYFETELETGIVLESGEKISGDVVLGADGVRSKARELVLGYEDKPKSSGYAVWRTWFDSKDMLADPETAHFCNQGDTFQGWIGQDVHFLFSTIKNGSDCCWVLTHRDLADIDESWQFPGHLPDVLELLKDWDPMCTKIVSKTPPELLVDWKLVYRDPLPTWVSTGRRIALVGDAAHPFLPTSAQGATQAMEDGVTIAICLRKAAEKAEAEAKSQDAITAFQEIRYERVKAVQKTGETTRDMWHKTDWVAVKTNPDLVKFPREEWIHGHDAEKHAEEVFDEVVKGLREKARI